jgi:hypothetical protein
MGSERVVTAHIGRRLEIVRLTRVNLASSHAPRGFGAGVVEFFVLVLDLVVIKLIGDFGIISTWIHPASTVAPLLLSPWVDHRIHHGVSHGSRPHILTESIGPPGWLDLVVFGGDPSELRVDFAVIVSPLSILKLNSLGRPTCTHLRFESGSLCSTGTGFGIGFCDVESAELVVQIPIAHRCRCHLHQVHHLGGVIRVTSVVII